MNDVCFQEVFSHHGVILRSPNIRDDDSYCNGTLSIVQYVSINLYIMCESVVENQLVSYLLVSVQTMVG